MGVENGNAGDGDWRELEARDDLLLKEKSLYSVNRRKVLFVTGVKTIFDQAIKEGVDAVLTNQFHGENSQCTLLEGTSTIHHFQTTGGRQGNRVQEMKIRAMPCLCSSCMKGAAVNCNYKHITSTWQIHNKQSTADKEQEKMEKFQELICLLLKKIITNKISDFDKFTSAELSTIMKVCKISAGGITRKTEKEKAILNAGRTLSSVHQSLLTSLLIEQPMCDSHGAPISCTEVHSNRTHIKEPSSASLSSSLTSTSTSFAFEKDERELEGAQRAKSLLRPLTEAEIELVHNALYGEGNPQKVLAKYESKETGFIDTITRESMRRFQPGNWLNDEDIHYYFLMLAQRDANLAHEEAASSPRIRCHFFKSFFMTKLLDEGKSNRYTYSNVKAWTKNVPGGDIFCLDKVFIPVNISNVHWTCAVIFVQEKTIQYFDSMGGDGMKYLKALLEYIKDEWGSKNQGQALPNQAEWKLVSTTIDTPRQENGFDCGVFTCMFADFLSLGYPLLFKQEHITQCRERIALSILKGSAI
jgi:sentrin-specific protease 1